MHLQESASTKGRALATAGKFISAYGCKDTDSASLGQVVEIIFPALRAGKLELQLYVMSDSYVGCDRVLPVRLKVEPLTRADKVRQGEGEERGRGALIRPHSHGEANSQQPAHFAFTTALQSHHLLATRPPPPQLLHITPLILSLTCTL